MDRKKATRRSCNYGRAKTSATRDADIVREYGEGCKWAALAYSAMLLLMAAAEVLAC